MASDNLEFIAMADFFTLLTISVLSFAMMANDRQVMPHALAYDRVLPTAVKATPIGERDVVTASLSAERDGQCTVRVQTAAGVDRSHVVPCTSRAFRARAESEGERGLSQHLSQLLMIGSSSLLVVRCEVDAHSETKAALGQRRCGQLQWILEQATEDLAGVRPVIEVQRLDDVTSG